MTNNDVLRRLRYVFDFDDFKMMALFELGGKKISRTELSSLLKKEEDTDYKNCSDVLLATYLNGLIIDRRGKREGPQPVPEKKMTNNLMLKKLKIALNLQSEDLLAILALADFKLSTHELSAFFRKPGNKHYRECKDQILRNFLQGMQIKYRDDKSAEKGSAKPGFDWG